MKFKANPPDNRAYSLTWVPEMGILNLKRSDGMGRPITEDELRAAFPNHNGIAQWIAFAKANPGVPCEWGK